MLKMTIDGEEVVSKNNFTIKEEMLSPSSTILNNTYPKTWEDDKDYTSRFYYPKDYAKLDIQNFSITPEEAGTTIDINGSATLTDVDTTKESRVLSLKGQTSQTGTPTPTNPIPVNVVSGDNEINICGKNLLNIDNWVKGRINNTTGNIEYANNVSSMVIGENNISFVVSQAWNSGIASDFIPISTGNYVFKYSHSREITMCIDTYDNQKTKIARIDAFTQTQTPTTRTFTISDSNVKYVRIHFEVNTANIEYIVSEMQLEKNSTSTTYEPYIGNTYNIDLRTSKNLFNKNTIINGKVIASNGAISDASGYILGDYIQVKPNTQYTISFTTSYTELLRIGYYKSDKTFIERPTSADNPWTITTPNNCYYIRICTPANYTNVQCEKGSQQTTYEEYSDIELCKIGTYQDYIYKEDGSWYLHKEIGKVVLDGTQSIPLASGTPRRFNATYTALGIDNVKSGSNALETQNNYRMCDHFYYASGVSTWGIYYLHNNWLVMLDADSVMTDANALKTWLSNNNTSIYYVLATPTTTLITNTLLLSQLNALESQ